MSERKIWLRQFVLRRSLLESSFPRWCRLLTTTMATSARVEQVSNDYMGRDRVSAL